MENIQWQSVERPGYLGKKRSEKEKEWNEKYGEGEWRIVFRLADGKEIKYLDIIKEYIQGYAAYFIEHTDHLEYFTQKYSFIYDIDPSISKEQSFDPLALYGKPGVANQFHNVAMNIAIEQRLEVKFKGEKPGQVRGLKKEFKDSVDTWPLEAKLQPGFIKCLHPEIIPATDIETWWINKDSIEALYQNAKTVEVKK